MIDRIPHLGHEQRLLILAAAPAEAAAICEGLGKSPPEQVGGPLVESGRICLALTGIGKVNAAIAVSQASFEFDIGAIVNLGVCGVLPDSPARLRSVIAASKSVYADEGLVTPERFLTCDEMGFPIGSGQNGAFGSDPNLLRWAVQFSDLTAQIATVSTCSGTDGAAREVARRTGAAAEAMEGAAVLHVASRIGIPAIEIRVVSNTTGDREAQIWDLRGALDALCALSSRMMGTVLPS